MNPIQEPGRQKRKRLRLRGFGPVSRSFSLNSYGYSPQKIEKSASKNHLASLTWFLLPRLLGQRLPEIGDGRWGMGDTDLR
jgi:hypothetical protein